MLSGYASVLFGRDTIIQTFRWRTNTMNAVVTAQDGSIAPEYYTLMITAPSGNIFGPKAGTTHAEVAAMLHRFFEAAK